MHPTRATYAANAPTPTRTWHLPVLLAIVASMLALAAFSGSTMGVAPSNVPAPDPGHASVAAVHATPLVPLAGNAIVTPSTGPVGTGVTFSGSGWTDGTPIDVTWTPPGGSGYSPNACTTTASASGTFSCAYTVPALAAGSYTYTVTGGGGSSSPSFTVIPELTDSPGSGPVGTKVTFSGTGWGDGLTVTVTWPRGMACSGAASALGTFTCSSTYTIPVAAHYTYTFTGNDSGPDTASTMFTVLASLSNSPTSGPVGTTVTFTGEGYQAGDAITVAWPHGASACAATTSDARGGFNCTFVVPAAAAYAYPFYANDTDSNAASSVFTVTASLSTALVSGTVGSQDTATGAGFFATVPVTVTWDDVGGATRWFCAATTSSVGAFSCVGTFVDGSYGRGNLIATDGTNSANVAFEILPSISVTPTSGPVGTTVTLSGSGWYPSEDGTADWTQGGGTACSFITNALGNISTCNVFSVPTMASGTYGITADDALSGHGLVASTTFTVTSSLTASLAGSVSTTDVGVPVTFTATASGGVGAYTYIWDWGDGSPYVATTSNINSHTFGSVPASGSEDVYVIVQDADGDQAVGGFAVAMHVDPTVDTPTASASSTDVGQAAVMFSATALGGTTPYASYAWTGLPATCSGPTTATPSCTFSTAGTISVTVAVTDTAGVSSGPSQPLLFTVDSDPAIAAVVPSQAGGDVGQTVTFWANASGGAGGDVFAWHGLPSASCVPATSESSTCGLSAAGSFMVWASVTDANAFTAQSAALSFVVFPTLTVGVPSAAPATLDLGQGTVLSVTTSGGLAPLAISWNGLPAGCASSDSGTLSCTPTSTGSSTVTVTVSDANGVSVTSAPISLVVSASLGSVSLSAARTSLDVGQTTTLNAQVVGGAGVLTYAWSGLPAGCASANSATVLCSPTAAGSFSVNAWANDTNGASAMAKTPLAITVSPALSVATPTLSSASVQSGQAVTFTTSTSGGAAAYSYTWNGLPSSCTGSGTSFTCSPGTVGTYTVSVTATDANGEQATSAPVALSVTAAPQTGFAAGANGLDWSILALVVLVLVLTLVAILVAGRRGGKKEMEDRPLTPASSVAAAPAASKPVEHDWDEKADSPTPASGSSPDTSSTSETPTGKSSE